MLGIYCRISKTKLEGKDRSINDQKQLGIEKARELGLDYKIYIDEGYSGTLDKIEDRPKFSELIEDIHDNIITSVYAYDQSRIERNTGIRFIITKIFKENDVKLHTSNGEINLFDEESEMFGNIISIMNQYYVTSTKKKIKSVLRRNVQEGKVHSKPAYGYSKDENGYLIIDDKESEIIKRIYSDSMSGIGTNKIAENLSTEGVLTKYNKIGNGVIKIKNKYTGNITTKKKTDIKWSGNTIRGIIKNTIYKGERSFSGDIYESPIIIDPIYWQKVNDNLIKNRNNSGKKVQHKYLLKGLLECGNCGRNMYGRTRENKKDHYYMCSSKRYKNLNCGNRSINIDVIENYIWEVVMGEYDVKKALENESNQINKLSSLIEGKVSLEDKLTTIDTRLKRITKLVIDEIITEANAKQERINLENSIDDIKIQLKNIKEEINYEERAKELKESLSFDFEKIKKETPYNKRKETIFKYISRIKVFYNLDMKSYFLLINFKTSSGVEVYHIKGDLKSIRTYLKTGEFPPQSYKLKELKELIEIGDSYKSNNTI